MPFCTADKITIPDGRFRPTDPEAVKGMVDSFKEVGQLHPVLVDKNMNLIAGLHRLEAAKELNREVWYATEEEGRLLLDNPYLRRAAEFQENFRRKEFSQAEKNLAMAEVDALMRQLYGSRKPGPGIDQGKWTQTDTAKKLGLKSHSQVSDAITIATAIKHGVPGVADAKTTQEAMAIVKKVVKLEAAQVLAERQAAKGETTEVGNPMEFFSNRLILGDCVEKLRELENGICSIFITDPPFGIDFDDAIASRKGTNPTLHVYDDNTDDIMNLLSDVVEEMARVGKASCFIIMFCGIQNWHTLRDIFRENGFSVHKKPLIWVKARTEPFKMIAGRVNNPALHPGSSYEAILYAWRGSVTLARQGQSDVFVYPTLPAGEKCHIAQRPIPLMEDIISRFYHPGTNPLLIDPFAGSGSTLIAARRLGIKNYFGYELDPINRERAIAFMVNDYMKEYEDKKAQTAAKLEEYD